MPPGQVAARLWRDHWPALVLGVAAAIIAICSRHAIYPAYSWNRDEPVYLWQVDALRLGYLTAPDGGFPELFRPWLSVAAHGSLFTQYTLGWPLVLLAATVSTGSPDAALALGASLAVVGTYALGLELLAERRIAVLGAALMVASPILPVQGGVYLSYLFTLGLGLLFGALLLSGLRRDRAGRIVLAGALLGWIFMTRPYDAVLWGATFAVYALIRERARWPRQLPKLLLAGLGCVPLVVATLAYNHRVTGGWLQFPITAADPLDTLGLGTKRLMPSFPLTDYTLAVAARATAKNLVLVPWFLVGGYAGLVVAGVGLWGRRRQESAWALVAVAAVFPGGYFVFWGTYLSSLAARISGPIYLIPLYAPICLLMASALVGWWQHRRQLAVGALAVLALATLPGMVTRVGVNHRISEHQAEWPTSVANLHEPALVFVADTGPYLLYTNPFSANAPTLDGQILYAVDDGPSMLDLIAAHPDRRPFRQDAAVATADLGPREHPIRPQVELTPIEVRRGPTLAVQITATAESSGRIDVSTSTGSLQRTTSTSQPTQLVRISAANAPGGLALADRGMIAIVLTRGTLRQRAQLVYRVVDDHLEVMLPAGLQSEVTFPDHREWRHVTALEGWEIDVTRL